MRSAISALPSSGLSRIWLRRLPRQRRIISAAAFSTSTWVASRFIRWPRRWLSGIFPLYSSLATAPMASTANMLIFPLSRSRLSRESSGVSLSKLTARTTVRGSTPHGLDRFLGREIRRDYGSRIHNLLRVVKHAAACVMAVAVGGADHRRSEARQVAERKRAASASAQALRHEILGVHLT